MTKVIEITVPLYINIHESLLQKEKKKTISTNILKFVIRSASQ